VHNSDRAFILLVPTAPDGGRGRETGGSLRGVSYRDSERLAFDDVSQPASSWTMDLA
jgi:hypothetical protein